MRSLLPHVAHGGHAFAVAVPAFGQYHHLRGEGGGEPVELGLGLGGRHAIVVTTYDVNAVVAGVPRLVAYLACPHPDEVVESVVVDEAVVHQPPQCLVGLSTLGAPPEPRLAASVFVGVASCFVQRTPHDGDVGFLHQLQVGGHLVQVFDDAFVLLALRVADLGDVKRRLAIAAARSAGPPRAVVGGHVPVPHGTHKTSGSPPLSRHADVAVVHPSLRIHVLRGVGMDEVEDIHRRPTPRPFINVLRLVSVPAHVGNGGADTSLAVQLIEHVEHSLRLSSGLGCAEGLCAFGFGASPRPREQRN